MKRFWLLIILLAIIVASLSIFIYNNSKETGPLNRYCNDVGCVYTKYKIEDLRDIPINSNSNINQLRSFNTTFIFINPNVTGNFTVAFLNLVIYLGKSSQVVPTCTEPSKGCNYYTNDSLEEYFWLFYDNKTYLINGTKVLRIYIVNSTENEIEIDRNFIFLKGDEDGITKVLDKFLLYWYGIINS